MKNSLVYSGAFLLLLSCTTSKEIVQKTTEIQKPLPPKTILAEKSTSDNKIMPESPQLSVVVNKIIETNTNSKASQIARSNVRQTENGYTWKFTNVATGKSYEVFTNERFEEVKISKLSSL